MIIGVSGEKSGDRRVAIVPKNVAAILQLNVAKVLVESGAGEGAFYSDQAFEAAGATISTRDEVYQQSDVVLTLSPPAEANLANMVEGKVLLGDFSPLENQDLVTQLAAKGISSFSLDLIPRTTRAQAMDILSSMGTIAGYKAVLVAAAHLPSFFPMFMTAAGTITPAKVLIMGAGVAGLQAIATARRLGAVVHSFDVRAAAREEVLSLGAKFVDVEGATDDKSAGGYAVEQTEEYKKRQAEAVAKYAAESDVIICTAKLLGRKAPILLTREVVERMKPGSVVVDLAAGTGGNCELTQPNKVIEHKGVSILGDTNLAATVPRDASLMFGNNLVNFLKLIIKEGNLDLNLEDDIVAGTLITHNKEVVHEWYKKMTAVQA